MAGHSYRDLDVWQKAMDLVVVCYKLAQRFPENEKYGLINQFQRAAVSIPANIAEGQARQYVREFIQYLSIAQGSLAEVETYVQLAERLGYVNNDKVHEILNKTDQVARMIAGLQKSLKKPKTNNQQQATKNSIGPENK
jgi:four helix bundle protein